MGRGRYILMPLTLLAAAACTPSADEGTLASGDVDPALAHDGVATKCVWSTTTTSDTDVLTSVSPPEPQPPPMEMPPPLPEEPPPPPMEMLPPPPEEPPPVMTPVDPLDAGAPLMESDASFEADASTCANGEPQCAECDPGPVPKREKRNCFCVYQETAVCKTLAEAACKANADCGWVDGKCVDDHEEECRKSWDIEVGNCDVKKILPWKALGVSWEKDDGTSPSPAITALPNCTQKNTHVVVGYRGHGPTLFDFVFMADKLARYGKPECSSYDIESTGCSTFGNAQTNQSDIPAARAEINRLLFKDGLLSIPKGVQVTLRANQLLSHWSGAQPDVQYSGAPYIFELNRCKILAEAPPACGGMDQPLCKKDAPYVGSSYLCQDDNGNKKTNRCCCAGADCAWRNDVVACP